MVIVMEYFLNWELILEGSLVGDVRMRPSPPLVMNPTQVSMLSLVFTVTHWPGSLRGLTYRLDLRAVTVRDGVPVSRGIGVVHDYHNTF